MPTKTKPIDIEELNKIEMKNDGKDAQRFEAMLHKVITTPREVILRREQAAKEAKQKKA